MQYLFILFAIIQKNAVKLTLFLKKYIKAENLVKN